MSSILEEILVLLKKKKTITVIILIVVGIIVMNIFKGIYRNTIREQQIDSVGHIIYKNKQFKNIQEKEVVDLLKKKDQQVIAFIEPSDNKGYAKVEKMFNQKNPIANFPDIVYVYEPVYSNPKLKTELKLNDKNTFLVLDEGKEIGRYGFNDLSVEYDEIATELTQIINPKIPRKQPVRINTEDQEQTENDTDVQTHTSEVFFE